MVTRYGPRVPVTANVLLAGDRTSCDGRVLNMSTPGCLIECMHRLRVGDYVQLRILLPDHSAPVNVPLAVIRWVNGKRAGVEFIRSSKVDQHRLTTLVHRHGPRVAGPAKWKEAVTLLGATAD
jgi:hypothetical protein